MIDILHHPDDSGYPAEYLASRIRGRRVRLISNWDDIVFAPDPFTILSASPFGGLLPEASGAGIWRHLQQEYRWVYFQMDRKLRDIFQPFFAYPEIRTLTACLRYRVAASPAPGKRYGGRGLTDRESSEKIMALLDQSLLSEDIKDALIMDKGIVAALDRLEKEFRPRGCTFRDVFQQEGLQAVEQRLPVLFLEHTMRSRLHPFMKSFFSRLIDMKNLISAYKYMRWSIQGMPDLIGGGTIRTAALKGVLASQDISGVMRLAGMDGQGSDAAALESILLRRLAGHARRMARENSVTGLVLDHLLRVLSESVNVGLVLYGRGIERETLREELAV